MKMNETLYLSHILDRNTPTYGNRNTFCVEKKSNIEQGDIANDTNINTTVHIGTHLDMPYHFYQNGQTIEDFDINYFTSDNILYINFDPESIIIKDDLISILKNIKKKQLYEILIVKTGICHYRNKNIFWEKNYGFDPSVATYLHNHFPNIRILGFDSISVSSFSDRMLGRESHKAFLNPEKPILLLEDMNLITLNKQTKIDRIIIAPLRISNCDGLPCTVLAEVS